MTTAQDPMAPMAKYQTNGYVGLANLGNTCFLNSCLQILNHTYELNAFLDTKRYENTGRDIPDTIILREWDELRKLMWTDNGVVSPNRFVYHVQQIARIKDRDIFTGWAQNDLSEFLYFLIDCMHNSIARKINMRITGKAQNQTDTMAVKCYDMLKEVYSKEYSEIMEMFYAIHVSEIKSTDDQIVYSTKPEHFFILNLEINTANGQPLRTLAECFDYFTSPEIMSGENAWYNEQTREKQSAVKKMSFWSFPKVLVIMLKRFSADGERKLNQPLDFPIHGLDLSKYVRGYNAATYVYDLFGVCNHMGDIMGGHYTSFVKNAKGEWVHFNDTHVDIVTQESVVSPMAYTLFYRIREP
jgi:ubiquitin C-terminal hydrolase